jgi:hypothetical protein
MGEFEQDERVEIEMIASDYEEFIYQLYCHCVDNSRRCGYMIMDKCSYSTFYKWVKTVSTGPPKYV